MRPAQDTRARLRVWGYHVTTAGGWVTAAGHGHIHRWHGWEAVPSVTTWTGAFDGAAHPNPGPAAWGAWLDTPLGDPAWSGSGSCGMATNNVAEWSGLIALLHAARSFGVASLTIHGDSQLVVHQFTGAYRIQDPRLKRLAEQAHRVARNITVEIAWWPRSDNARADALSQRDLAATPLTFAPAALDPLGSGRFVAHGTRDYVVDLTARTCTCPSFQFRHGLCNHLRAAGA